VLKAISAVLDGEDGKIEKGSILWQGRPIEKRVGARRGRPGPGAGARRPPPVRHADGRREPGRRCPPAEPRRAGRDACVVYELFPRLADRRQQLAGYLSGGEQQMVAIGRALMSRPKLLALDEPSLGLAPLVVSEIFRTIQTLRDRSGLTILLIEQNASRALAIADYGYIMENGRVVLDGDADALQRNADVREFYLGVSRRPGAPA
jgi:branched-chain amino acid transport system ATP-binding protein